MAMYCADYQGVSTKLSEISGLSGFLHDIGKATNYFQKITIKKESKSKVYANKKLKSKFHPRHNEVSWMYAETYAKPTFKKIGLQAIYWHHGTFLRNKEIESRDYSSIYNEMNNFDSVTDFFDVCNAIINEVKFPFDIKEYLNDPNDPNDSDDPNYSDEKISKLFSGETSPDLIFNSERLIVRGCVICADHIVSSLTSDELTDLIDGNEEKYFEEKYFNEKFSKKSHSVNINDLTAPISYDANRFQSQIEIVKKCEKTTVVKAPAGFGKSAIGVIWGVSQTGPVYWVCPRNTVAESVYGSILSEINNLNINLSVELYLTSERKKCTNPDIPECKSDIIVTNIDNLLAPMVNQRHTSRIFDVNAKNVIFDEFHEFLTDAALFGAFNTYMKARNILSSEVKTLLLSATPSLLHKFWEGKNSIVTVLPDDKEHYSAQHTSLYQFDFYNDFEEADDGSLTMYSSIKNVQENFDKNKFDIIIQSKYL